MNKILLVGTVSNVSKTLSKEVRVVSRALSDLELVGIFLVESDSKDLTLEILSKLSNEISGFDFLSLGDLRNTIPDRIARIRFCRNQYVEYIRNLHESIDFDYVAVADLDGMNLALKRKGVQSSFSRNDWAGVLANQRCGYYDLLALRHPDWCPNDVMNDLRELQENIQQSSNSKIPIISRLIQRLSFDRARREAIYSQMRVIRKRSDWISVDSGFGGFGIYKVSEFLEFNYDPMSPQEYLESEHVAFSRKIRECNKDIFINPAMINNYWNTYNINRYFIIRQLRQFYWNSRLRERIVKK